MRVGRIQGANPPNTHNSNPSNTHNSNPPNTHHSYFSRLEIILVSPLLRRVHGSLARWENGYEGSFLFQHSCVIHMGIGSNASMTSNGSMTNGSMTSNGSIHCPCVLSIACLCVSCALRDCNRDCNTPAAYPYMIFQYSPLLFLDTDPHSITPQNLPKTQNSLSHILGIILVSHCSTPAAYP